MDAAQRWQHWVLAVSFIVLAWSGFALKFPDSFVAHSLGSGENFRRWSHRIAGVALLLAGAYHIGYVAATREGRRLVRDMLPGLKDARTRRPMRAAWPAWSVSNLNSPASATPRKWSIGPWSGGLSSWEPPA